MVDKVYSLFTMLVLAAVSIGVILLTIDLLSTSGVIGVIALGALGAAWILLKESDK